MTVEFTGRMVNITPKPRILKILSKIEFDAWQCIAELVDNSFDEFIDIKRSGTVWTEPFEVGVRLPNTTNGDATVVISDNGRGMAIERITDAVTAAFSGNDPTTKLGLFGLGFNVATARIGMVTRFWSTRAGDADWIGVEVDLDSISATFEAPEIRRPKDSPDQHGTMVEISRLQPFAVWFTRSSNQSRLRDILGGVYSYLLDAEGFKLKVNEIAVKPHRHCVWDKARNVTRDGEVIPAVIEIDEPLSDLAVCQACGSWQDPTNTECDKCESKDLAVRERRIWGWLGIQRYLDPKFGIDFLRNGRKILRSDRSLFEWRDPVDPGAPGDVEYPVEVPYNQGRIVGEIHLDHVAVAYTKDSFDTADPGWRHAITKLRGESPLLPKKAAAQGYAPNNSPLARLHRGYRRNDPGASYLNPGNGNRRFENPDWAAKFRAGDPDFQTDKVWWDAVLMHDKLVEEAKEAKRRADAARAAGLPDPTDEFRTGAGTHPEPEDGAAATGDGATGDDKPAAAGAGAGPAPETDADKIDRLARHATPLMELSGELVGTGVPGRPVKVAAWQVREALAREDKRRVPVLMLPGRGGSYSAFVDVDHPHFQTFADDPADIVLMELAQHMLTRAQGVTTTISALYAELKDRYLSSHAIDPNRLVGDANQAMRDIQERMVSCVSENPRRPWENALNEAERSTTSDRLIEVYRVAETSPLIDDGSYLPLVPPPVVPRIVEEWPEAFFDNRLFAFPYADVTSASARRQTVALITGYLLDVAWLTTTPPNPSKEQLIRATLSLRLLPENLVA